jgi:hypothetical protein
MLLQQIWLLSIVGAAMSTCFTAWQGLNLSAKSLETKRRQCEDPQPYGQQAGAVT